MDRPAIDRNPGEPEVYYFDETVREAVLAKQKATEEPVPVRKATQKTAKKKG